MSTIPSQTQVDNIQHKTLTTRVNLRNLTPKERNARDKELKEARLRKIEQATADAKATADNADAKAGHALHATRELASVTGANTAAIAKLAETVAEQQKQIDAHQAKQEQMEAELVEQRKLMEQVTELRDMLDVLQKQPAPTDSDEHKNELELLTTQVSELQKQLIATNSAVKGTRAMATSNHTGGQLSRGLQQQQITELREKLERLEKAREIEATRKATQAAFLNGNFKPCLSGVKCRHSDCKFAHPTGRPASCTYGSKCYNHKCKNLHPKDRQLLCPSIHKGVPCTRGDKCHFSHQADVHQH
jgi:hypothetical protein